MSITSGGGGEENKMIFKRSAFGNMIIFDRTEPPKSIWVDGMVIKLDGLYNVKDNFLKSSLPPYDIIVRSTTGNLGSEYIQWVNDCSEKMKSESSSVSPPRPWLM